MSLYPTYLVSGPKWFFLHRVAGIILHTSIQKLLSVLPPKMDLKANKEQRVAVYYCMQECNKFVLYLVFSQFLIQKINIPESFSESEEGFPETSWVRSWVFQV